MASSSLTKTYESLPKVAKLLLQFFFGYVISGAYRIAKYFETKNIITLVVGILALVTGIGNAIFWVADFVTELLNDKVTFFAD